MEQKYVFEINPKRKVYLKKKELQIKKRHRNHREKIKEKNFAISP